MLTVLARHGHSYLKLSAAVLRIAQLPDNACSLFCGKYLELPAVQSHELLAGLNMASLTHSMTSALASKVKYLGAVTIVGQPAWLLQDSHGNSIYVAEHGKPYILREVPTPPTKGSADLTQWNAVQIPGPPPPSQVVHPRQLMR